MITSAFIGTINVTGTETGTLLSIKQAILPQTINDVKKRNTVYALYNMVGTFAMSAGILASGLPRILEHKYGLYQIDYIRLLYKRLQLFSCFSHDLFVLKQLCKTFL